MVLLKHRSLAMLLEALDDKRPAAVLRGEAKSIRVAALHSALLN